MAVRVFRCSECHHRMRLYGESCGKCHQPKPIWQTGGAWTAVALLIPTIVVAGVVVPQ